LANFVTNTKTKDSHTKYLGKKVLRYFEERGKVINVSTQAWVETTDLEELVELFSNHEEADTIIILHALDAARRGETVCIMSPDTDVFLLSLKYCPYLGQDCKIILGSGVNQRMVALKPIYYAFGNKLASALHGFHSLTGCDTTGKFSGKVKQTCWNTFCQAKPHIIEGFI
jgi:hypothetical protein